MDLGLSSLRELGIELLGDRIKVLQQILLLKDEPQKEVKGEQQVPVSPASETDEKILVPVVGDLHEHHPTLERSHSKKKSSQPPPLVTESASSESSPPSTSTLHSVVTLERDLEASIQTHYQTLERQGIVSKKAEDETRDSTLLSPNLRLLDSPSRSDAAPSESVQPTTYHQHGMLPPVVVNRPQDSPVATSLPKPSNSSHFTISDYASESSMPQSPFGSPSHHHHTSQTQQQQPSLATASVRQLNHQTSYSYSIDTRRNPEDESKLNSQSPQASYVPFLPCVNPNKPRLTHTRMLRQTRP